MSNLVSSILYNTDTEKYIFVEQEREAVEGKTVEIPSTIVEEGETAEEAVKRCIAELAGYKVDETDVIMEFYVSPESTNNVTSIYYTEVSEIINEDANTVEVDDLGYGGNLIFKGEEGEMVPPYRLIDAKSILAVNHVEHNRIMKDTVDVLTQAKLKTF